MKRLFKEYHNYLLLLLIIIVFSIILISISFYNSKHSLNKDITKLNLFNIDTLIIVSHPSDETLWSSTRLISDNCLVVCLSCTNNKETTEFIKNLNITNDLYLTLEYPEYKDNTRINWHTYKKDISKDIKKILNVILNKMYEQIAKKEVETIMEKIRSKLKFAPEDYKIAFIKNKAK